MWFYDISCAFEPKIEPYEIQCVKEHNYSGREEFFVTSVAFEWNIIRGPNCCSIGRNLAKVSRIKKSVDTTFRYSKMLYVVASEIAIAEIAKVVFL